jgi:hypothetical protein
MKIPQIAKFALKVIVMDGVNEVLGNVIKTTTPDDITKVKQIIVNIGKLAISDTIAGIVADNVIKDVEEVVEVVEAVTTKPHRWPVGSDFKAEGWTKEAVKGMSEEEFRKSIRESLGEVLSKSINHNYPIEELLTDIQMDKELNYIGTGISVEDYNQNVKALQSELNKDGS